ncbi:MAG: glycosyl hydrolase, partial [Phycisphaerae bacterium]|nr:glycosyl hydrolase [Phycisphaerae bacterium]
GGITADLEAMKRVGIGGVLIMEVDQGAPVGPVDFMGDKWRELFRHVHAEAQRLGLEVNMNNDAGWNGSGGPWIKPEQAMQEVVWTETEITGPQKFSGTLVQPMAVAGYYRDIAVLAFKRVGDYRIPNVESKAAFQRRGIHKPSKGDLSPLMTISRDGVVNLTEKMNSAGRLEWEIPEGDWTVIRFGHTCTGVENAPAPKTGRGLECDKLNREGIEANFNAMMAKLADDTGLEPGKTQVGLVATHIDSWENGSQNWTAKMRDEFQRRRGYDLLPFLPVLTGRVVVSSDVSERFLWDVRQTVSELVIENYAGRMKELAHARGMRFTVEAYGSPCDHIPYGGQSDEPMGEFWTPGGGAIETCRGMASTGHVYGKRIIGAEAFTSADQERWLEHPAILKSHGDRAFCEGINRFVFHRYALQPWTQDYRPGMTMGPWGQHYERTQTWWEWTPSWHEYLARCQFMLRQGLFVADICRLQAEAPPQGFGYFERKGYDWDECGADVVLTRMSVRDGRIVLPDGMSYRLLVLPQTNTMTPRLLSKIKELVEAGATIVGPRPTRSPSLSGYPECDAEI